MIGVTLVVDFAVVVVVDCAAVVVVKCAIECKHFWKKDLEAFRGKSNALKNN